MATDVSSGTVEFPYKPSISNSIVAGASVCALGSLLPLIFCVVWIRVGHWPSYSDIKIMPFELKKMFFFSAACLFFGLYYIGRVPAVMGAGNLNSIRISPEGISVPKGYFEIRHVLIADGDIKSVSRDNYLIRVYHRRGTQDIERACVPDTETYDEIWRCLEKYRNLQHH